VCDGTQGLQLSALTLLQALKTPIGVPLKRGQGELEAATANLDFPIAAFELDGRLAAALLR
jgi:hypothetical protein